MSCPVTLNNIVVDCSLTAGGIKRVLVCRRDVLNIPAPDASTHIIDVSNFTATESGVKFVEYMFRPQTSSITSTSATDVAIGSASVTTEIALQFTRVETAKRVALQQLIGVGVVALVQTFDGQWLFCGKDMPMYATNIVQLSGLNISDLNGYTCTMTDISMELPYVCHATDAEIATLKSGVPEAQ